MRLRQLRYFIGVADTGSFTGAAGLLHIAQPALSNQIGSLEQELGVQLLVRHSRGIDLTSAGRFFLERAREIVSLVDEAKVAVNRYAETSQVDINVGLPTTTTEIMTIPLLDAVRRSHPSVNLHIVEGMTGHLEKWLMQNDLSVAVLFAAPEADHFSIRHLGQERLVIIGSMKEGFRDRKSLNFSEVIDLPIIHSTPAHQLRRMIDNMARMLRRPVNYVAEIDSLAQINMMVRSGLGYTILPMRYAASGWSGPEIHTWELEGLPDGGRNHDIGIKLVASPTFMREDYSESLLDEMEGTVRHLIETGQWLGATLEN